MHPTGPQGTRSPDGRAPPGAPRSDRPRVSRPLPPAPDQEGTGTATPAWHALALEDVQQRLGSGSEGLTGAEAARRLEAHGPNELAAFERASPWHTLAAQFKNVLILILLAATVLSGLLGHAVEAIVIAVIVLLAVGLGVVQE